MTSAPAAASGAAGASAPDEEEAKKVARELEERIAGRYEKLRREEQHLATLHKQIQEMPAAAARASSCCARRLCASARTSRSGRAS